jgi:MFS transporter, putative metabolite:H+ symporter
VMFCYMGLAIGDLASGWLSQWVRSRKRVLRLFIGMTALGVAVYFAPWPKTTVTFYALCFYLGLATGYWAVFVTIASEHFGTNLRATATTTIPNFVRGAVVPVTSTFQALTPLVGIATSGIAVGVVTLVVAIASVSFLHETYGRDLNFLEH